MKQLIADSCKQMNLQGFTNRFAALRLLLRRAQGKELMEAQGRQKVQQSFAINCSRFTADQWRKEDRGHPSRWPADRAV